MAAAKSELIPIAKVLRRRQYPNKKRPSPIVLAPKKKKKNTFPDHYKAADTTSPNFPTPKVTRLRKPN